jgi:probable HAF family extracellular repeat protein
VTSIARAINDSGQIAGDYSSIVGGNTYAIVWDGSTYTELGGFGRSSFAHGINNSGQVVGYSLDDEFNVYATLWTTTNPNPVVLGPSDSRSFAYGINNGGQIIGTSCPGSLSTCQTNADYRATLWDGSVAYDLNTLVDSTSGWTLYRAWAINDLGQIVGEAVNDLGHSNAFLLTPTAPIPEPEIYAMMGVGLALLGWMRRRTRSKAAAA